MEFFFEANEVMDPDRRQAMLLSGVGTTTYSLLLSLLSPETPKDKTYAQLMQILLVHFSPKPSEIVQQFKFISRVRKSNDSVANYVVELRRVAQHCEYGEAMPHMLRYRLVCAVLLSEGDLTFGKALMLCQAMESAARGVRDLQGMGMEDMAHTWL